MKHINGYEQIYLDLAADLAGFDLVGNASHLGLRVVEGGVGLRFLGRDYQVSARGVEVLDGRPVSFNHLSLAAHYAMSPGRGEPSGQFLPLRRLTGLVEGQGAYDRDGLSRPLIKKFGSDRASLEAAIDSLEGCPAGPDPSGGLAWLFQPFPKVALKLIHHPADEEFPAEYQLRFDSSATRFMAFEALGFLAGVFVQDLCAGGPLG
ncbi:MAG: DUF3786 domain-containing protein [Candidatus Adiutrix sp.]|jgi:hypothetical protein|nr:DUF3786 domain-containing protein [Candidatus Adiutrix sp.]